MAIYHLSVKAISRAKGRSATAAAAYRAACKILDERTGETYDYHNKKGVFFTDIVLPIGAPDWAKNRAQLWNAAERAEKRKDACVAREFEVALPCELSRQDCRQLVLDFAQEMADREGCAVDVAVHDHGKGGDVRNIHAHLLRTTRKVNADGFGEKLDTEKAGRKRADDLEAIRTRWAEMTNDCLRQHGVAVCVDYRSLAAQGIDCAPTQHLGVAVTGFERRTGWKSTKRIAQEENATQRIAKLKELEELERNAENISRSILELKTVAEEQNRKETLEIAASGVAGFKARFEAEKAKAIALAKEEQQRKAEANKASPQELNRTSPKIPTQGRSRG